MASTVPREMIRTKMVKDQFADWDAFVAHLQDRAKPVPLAELLGAKKSLLWALPQSAVPANEDHLSRLAALHGGATATRSRDAEIVVWLKEQLLDAELSNGAMVLAIGATGALPSVAAICSEDEWHELLQAVQQFADKSVDQSNRLLGQLANEVRFTCAYQLREIQKPKAWKPAVTAWVAGLKDMLDSDGAVEARYCELIPLLLATWTRVYLMAVSLGYQLDEDTQQQWEWFLRYGLRLMRCDGTTMLADPSIEYSLDLFKAAVSTSTDKEDRAISRLVLPGGNPKKKKTKQLDETGTFSEWAGLGVMQQDWSPRSPRLAVAIDEESIRMEVCRGNRLFQLSGMPDVSINGKLLQPVDTWDEIASHFDDDIDYIELEIELQDDVRLQRQLCLIHDDNVALVADSVNSPKPQRIDYQIQLDLPDSVTPMQESKTNEIYLRQKRICGLLLPLNLSEWKSATLDDRFAATDDKVTLNQSTMGKTLYAPLLVQLDPFQSMKPRTWRRLTVADQLEIVGPDVARAYRIRIGVKQWVIYKSFSGTGNRTFLGQNHTCDLFIGRFQKDGNVEELLILEP